MSASVASVLGPQLPSVRTVHPDVMARARHLEPRTVNQTPHASTFRPKHCAGTSCFHEHADEHRCSCRRAILPADGTAVQVGDRMHGTDFCPAVAPSAAALPPLPRAASRFTFGRGQ